MASMAVEISLDVVLRPRLSRTVALATSCPSPMAASTWLVSLLVAGHAAPAEHATPWSCSARDAGPVVGMVILRMCGTRCDRTPLTTAFGCAAMMPACSVSRNCVIRFVSSSRHSRTRLAAAPNPTIGGDRRLFGNTDRPGVVKRRAEKPSAGDVDAR